MNINEVINKVSAEHPYKIPGDRDSYSQYNEAWQDCIARIEQELELMQRENQFEFCFDNVKSFDCPCGRRYINTAAHENGDGETTEYCQKEYEDALKEDGVSKEFLEECKRAADKYRRKNDGWIPVERELPPNAKQEGAFFPKYQVMTKYGVTEGWYNPDAEGWYVLIWFMTERYLYNEIDLNKGDKPKIVFIPDEVNSERNILIAWKEMELYRPERSDNHDGE